MVTIRCDASDCKDALYGSDLLLSLSLTKPISDTESCTTLTSEEFFFKYMNVLHKAFQLKNGEL